MSPHPLETACRVNLPDCWRCARSRLGQFALTSCAIRLTAHKHATPSFARRSRVATLAATMRAALHFLFFAVAHCAGLRKAPDLSDIESLARSAELAADSYLAESAKLPSSEQARRLIALHNAESLGEMHRARFAEQQEAAKAALGPAHCPQCARSYREVCPVGWGQDNGGICEAPPSYDGPCKGYAYLSELTTTYKQRFAERCAVCWSCSEHSHSPTGRREGPIGSSGAAA